MPSTSGFGGIVFSMPPLGQLLKQISEEKYEIGEDSGEKEKKEEKLNIDNKTPAVAEVEKNNPPRVEDKVEAGDLPKKKEIKASGAPKLESDKVKYTKLSNFVPVEYKRGECEAPKLTGEEIDEEELTEWEEGEEEVDEKVSKMHMAEGKGYTVKQVGDKWKVLNSSGAPAGEYSDKDSAEAAKQRMNRSLSGDYGDKYARPSTKNEAGLKPKGYGAPGERKGTNKPARAAEKKRQRRQGKTQKNSDAYEDRPFDHDLHGPYDEAKLSELLPSTYRSAASKRRDQAADAEHQVRSEPSGFRRNKLDHDAEDKRWKAVDLDTHARAKEKRNETDDVLPDEWEPKRFPTPDGLGSFSEPIPPEKFDAYGRRVMRKGNALAGGKYSRKSPGSKHA